MKLARILLASAAIALLAACDSDPVGPSARSDAPRPRRDIILSDTTSIEVSADGLGSLCEPIITTLTVDGITTTVTVCDGRGPQIGSGN